MSKLIPERRPDKNGRMVTRHVLPSKAPVGASRIPAPKAPKMDRESNLQSLTSSICTQLEFALHDQSEWYEIKDNLESYSDHTLERLRAAWQPRTQLAGAIARLVYHGDTEDFIQEFAAFGGVVRDEETSGMEMATPFVRSLHHYPQLPQVDNYAKADEGTKTACRALMTLASRLESERDKFSERPVKREPHDYDSYDTPVIQDGDFVQLVVDRPEDAGLIGDIAVARGTTDAKVIREILDHDVTSLSSGLL